MFETCTLRSDDVNLKVILTAAYTKKNRIAKLRHYMLDKWLVWEIFEELFIHKFPHYVNMLLYLWETDDVANAILV